MQKHTWATATAAMGLYSQMPRRSTIDCANTYPSPRVINETDTIFMAAVDKWIAGAVIMSRRRG